MTDSMVLYDETEHTSTRYVGFVGNHGRFDLAITTTAHFYGKKLVCSISGGRSAILSDADAADAHYLAQAFNIQDPAEAEELSMFLQANL